MFQRYSASTPRLALLAFVFVAGVPALAEARTYGELHLTKTTKLTTDHYGSIVFDADDITLDCANFMVHSSQHSKINCRSGRDKCAITADGRDGITIKNCKVVGQFNVGVHVASAVDAYVYNVHVNTASGTGFHFHNDLDATGRKLTALENSLGVYVSDDTDGYFTEVTIDSPSGNGFYSYNSYGTIFSEITADNCGGTSFYSGRDRNITLQYSDLSYGRSLGFFSFESDGSLIASNTIIGNDDYGLTLSGSTDCHITENYAFDNFRFDAVDHNPSNGNTWSGNEFGTTRGVPASH
jgi:parallel beta-helix repeat protein